MINAMVDKIKSTIEVPVWVLMLLVPILVTICITLITITMSQSNTITKLQVESETTKANVQMLRDTKVDTQVFRRFESTVDRIEIKLDSYINKNNP
jgi:hypothetical protein